MSYKWRQRENYDDGEEEEIQVKGSSSHLQSRDDEGRSRREKSPDGKHKHKHHKHHKKHKKDRKRSRSRSSSRGRRHSKSRSRSRSRSKDKDNRSKEVSWRLQGTSRQLSYRQESMSSRGGYNSYNSKNKSGNSSRSHFRDTSDSWKSDSRRKPDVETRNNKSGDSSSDDDVAQPFNPKNLPVEASKLKAQIEKRKLLWSKKVDKPAEEVVSSVWKQPSFNDDNDGKVSAKFKRLMGIKDETSSKPSSASSSKSTGPRQDEYFANLEKQYEVARATTHTQRGLGLGFSSSSRLLPR